MIRRRPKHRTIRRTRGSALITVTLIGLFVMLLAAALVNQFATAEAEAIAHSLAKTRIYWASMGHINYGLSRIHREGLCGGECTNDDTDRIADLNAYLGELNDAGVRNWDFGDNYQFSLSAGVTDGPIPTPVPNDGRVRATITLQAVTETPFDVLNGIEQRIPGQLIVDICLSPTCDAPNTKTGGANNIEALRRR